MRLLDKWADSVSQKTFNNIMIALAGTVFVIILGFSFTIISG